MVDKLLIKILWLNCCGMWKTVSWINNYFANKNNAYFEWFWLWVQELFVDGVLVYLLLLTVKTAQNGIYSVVPLKLGQFSPKSLLQTSHSSSTKVRYGKSFVKASPDLRSASVTAVMYALLCYIGPRYNGIQLYLGDYEIDSPDSYSTARNQGSIWI